VEKALATKIEPSAFEGRLTEKAVRRARRRIGRRQFPQFARLILDAARGKEVQLDPRQAELVEQGLGLDHAREDRIKDTDPWLRDEIDGVLQSLGKAVQPERLRQNLGRADDHGLESARDELRALLSVLKEFASISKLIFGPHAFGFDIFRDIDTSKPRVQSFLLLLWLDLQTHPGSIEALKGLISALPRPVEQTIGIEGLLQLGREIPEFADILNVRRLRDAIGDPEKLEVVNKELETRVKQHRAEVDAFMQRHPQLQQAIDNVLTALKAK
jgi:hypothetical protein